MIRFWGRLLHGAARWFAAPVLLLSCLFLVSAVGAAVAPCPDCPKASFGPAARAYRLSASTLDLALADFDGDANLDVAALSYGKVLILLGDPQGSFGDPAEVALPTPFGHRIVTGDLDGDGNLDFLVSHGDPRLEVALGKGDGTFAPVTQLFLSNDAELLAPGDFNGDGRLDIAALDHYNGSSLTLYFNSAGGLLTQGLNLPVGPSAIAVEAGDLDGDLLDDLVVANSGTLSLVFGRRMGPYPPAQNLDIGGFPGSIVLDDFNVDGNLDIAASLGPEIRLLLGSGAGSFTAGSISVPSGASTVISGDFDGNGLVDLFAGYASYFGSGPTRFLLGDGSGAFPTAYGGDLAFAPVFAADLNRDGISDLIGFDGGGPIVLLSAPGPRLELPPLLTIGGGPSDLVAADLNSDGTPDFVVASYYGLSILLSNPSAEFDFLFLDALDAIAGVAAGDLDGDGAIDLVAAGFDNAVVFRGIGGGRFADPTRFAVGRGARAVVLGDLNRDGKLDAALASPYSNSVSILKGTGLGSFLPALQYAAGVSPYSLALADLDGDSILDVVTANSGAGNLSVLLGDGTGGFFSISFVPIGFSPVFVAIEDMNGDGRLDLAATAQDALGAPSLAIASGDGEGHFGAPAYTSLPLGGEWFRLGDFNRDGAADAAVVGGGAPAVAILLNDGDGQLFPSTLLYSGGSARAVALAEFPQDGAPSVAVATEQIFGLGLFRNTNCRVRHLVVGRDVAGCEGVGSALTPQPQLEVTDDGGNVVVCDTGLVTAGILPGTGTSGAVLGGTTSAAAIGGVATFADLAVDLPGLGYRLEFSHAGAGKARSRTFSQGVTAGIGGPAGVCANGEAEYDAGVGSDRYE
ncbi:MAG: FG-GAP repeat domain-containing protein, partial [Thermoanaerobaculia bacterium]